MERLQITDPHLDAAAQISYRKPGESDREATNLSQPVSTVTPEA